MNRAIILSAGSGKRMNSNVKKQYMQLLQKPLVYYTLKAFETCEEIDDIIMVISEEDEEYISKEIILKYGLKKISTIAYGGKERYNSVYNALKYIDDNDIVLIHDGARPFVDSRLIHRLIKITQQGEACITAVKTKDTVKIVTKDGYVSFTPDRNNVWNVQTPQVFVGVDIKNAYEQMMQHPDENVTDDAMVMEKYGTKCIKVVEGSYENIKITTPDDIKVAEMLISKYEKMA